MRESHAHLNVSEHEFDIVAGEIAATLYHVGVPQPEHAEFMAIIESYRSMVVGPPEGSVPEQSRETAGVPTTIER